jgi:hypothetical protein
MTVKFQKTRYRAECLCYHTKNGCAEPSLAYPKQLFERELVLTGAFFAAVSARADQKLYRGLFLVVDLYFRKRRDTDQIDSVGCHITPGYGDRLHGLVDGARSYRLDLNAAVAAKHGRYRASHGFWFGISGNF